jgi:hypothetical protein
MKKAFTVIGFMLGLAVWVIGSEQYKKHEEIERGRRNTAKYFTLVFTPWAGVCTAEAFPLGQEKRENPAHHECVTDVHFYPAGADIVFVTYTNISGMRTIEKAAAMPEPVAIPGGAYTSDDGNAKWCE